MGNQDCQPCSSSHQVVQTKRVSSVTNRSRWLELAHKAVTGAPGWKVFSGWIGNHDCQPFPPISDQFVQTTPPASVANRSKCFSLAQSAVAVACLSNFLISGRTANQFCQPMQHRHSPAKK